MKQLLLNNLRKLVWLVPNSKLLSYVCEQYINKYNNQVNADPLSNGEHQFLKEVCKITLQPTIFDVGANVGDWTANVLTLVPTARIFAFEPHPQTFRVLANRYANNPNIVCINSGLGSEQGQLQMMVYGETSQLNSIHGRNEQQPISTELISITTIDDVCQEYNLDKIDFLKIDTEGHEYSVFKGAKKILNDGGVAVIQFEYGSNYILARVFLKDIFEYFLSLPYDMYRIMPKSLKPLKSYHEQFENFQYTNYALLHRNFLIDRIGS